MPNAAKCGWGPPSPPLHRPDRFPALFRLLVCATGVIHVVTAQSVGPRRTIMKTFTIDEQNNITAFGTQEEAAATTTDRKSTRLNSSHLGISYAVFCLKKN